MACVVCGLEGDGSGPMQRTDCCDQPFHWNTSCARERRQRAGVDHGGSLPRDGSGRHAAGNLATWVPSVSRNVFTLACVRKKEQARVQGHWPADLGAIRGTR